MSQAMCLVHECIGAAPDDADAVSARGRTLTYRQLRAMSAGMAAALRERGLTKGDRILITARDDVRLVSLLFAAARLGVVFSVVNRQVPVHVLEHIVDDCDPALVVTDDATVTATVERLGVATAAWDAIPLAAEAPDAPCPIPADPACLIYTSGTTAMPKAVVSTHAQMMFAATAIQSRLNYRPDDVVYCALPLSFDYGLYQIFLSAMTGAHLVLAPGPDEGPRWLLELVRRRVTVLPAVPPLASALLSLLDRTSGRPALRLITNTGSAMSRDVLAGLRGHLPDLRVQLMFGLTECKRIAIMDPDEDLDRPDAVGRPLPGTEVFTVDEQGNRLPSGESGEITVRGGNVMSGYWRRPELTRQRFVLRDGLFPELRTGDYGWIDHDGYLHFSGRRDDIYKQGAFRVSAVEVESAARRVPGVDAASVLVPDGDRTEAVLVVVSDKAPSEVLWAMRGEVEEYKMPRLCQVVSRLPSNANGKTDKRALAAQVADLVVDGV
ncbi:class I adenylate-forming enzyme family protein [Actinokineospora sp. UTMC 2448]|uniref:class I adenylate-forming enzyme family protein n=1 Tax=Actinokineospora sp. UTMC 2448 TaxID=2268449 RepID=UPI002164EE7C|nr:class I adenylate-forming enzyme family protein [Actinokineospora sp. UTMC 2448]UVS79498.1 Plipastatin synthase subunit A [Actinokineospora sp. UTMC 2448]